MTASTFAVALINAEYRQPTTPEEVAEAEADRIVCEKRAKDATKAFDDRLRRAAAKQGLRLHKSRSHFSHDGFALYVVTQTGGSPDAAFARGEGRYQVEVADELLPGWEEQEMGQTHAPVPMAPIPELGERSDWPFHDIARYASMGKGDGVGFGMTMDGFVVTPEYDSACLLYIVRCDDTRTGKAWRVVYRSGLVRDDSWHGEKIREFVGDAEPLHRQVLHDYHMIWRESELSIYEVP